MLKIKKLLQRPESFCVLIILILFFMIQIQSGQFFTPNNLTDLLAAYIVPGIMALGCLVVFISGGLDISFPALSSVSLYITLITFQNYSGTVLLPLLFIAVVSGLLGMLNGVLVAKFNFAPLIVTLSTESLFWGVLHGVIKGKTVSVLPATFKGLSTQTLWTAVNNQNGIASHMPVVFVFLVVAIVLFAFLLTKTTYGRKLYAVGGNMASAENIGINVFWIRVSAYMICGICAGIALLARSMIIGNYHPNAAFGMEFNVIAMVVIGGCSLTGGKGTVFGTLLGVVMIQTMNNSLALLNIPTYWQKFSTGIVMILGISMTAYRVLRNGRKLSGVMLKTETKPAAAATEVK